jgi:hypothetical protein
VMRRDEGVGIRRVLEFEVAGEIGRGRPRMGWKEQVEKDMVKAGLRRDDAQDRDCMAKWGIWLFVIGRRTLTPDLGENGVKTLVCAVMLCIVPWLVTYGTPLSPYLGTGMDGPGHSAQQRGRTKGSGMRYLLIPLKRCLL